jgi:hypothetical protein
MMIGSENQITQQETCPSTLSTKNPAWTTLELNPGLHGEKLVNNCLRYANM